MERHLDTRRRSVLKGISWRIIGTLDTVLISYLITGSIKSATAIGTVEVITKFCLYYFHERAWNKLSFFKSKQVATS